MIREQLVPFEYPSDEVSNSPDDLRRDALALALSLNIWVLRRSKTLKSQKARTAILEHLMHPHESRRQLCKLLKIRKSRYYELLRETRQALGIVGRPD